MFRKNPKLGFHNFLSLGEHQLRPT